MIKAFYNDARQCYRLKKLDIGEYAVIKRSGMCFHTHVFDAENAGRLFLMGMKAFRGLMKMETAVFTPTDLDGPIFSVDEVMTFGRSTLVLELYDTTISHPDFNSLDQIKQRYSFLPSYDPGDHPYYSFRLPVSDYKRGRRIKHDICTMAMEYSREYFRCLKNCSHIDSCSKKKRNAGFSDSLYQNGGPAVNQFKKMIGEAKTEEFLKKYMFCSV